MQFIYPLLITSLYWLGASATFSCNQDNCLRALLGTPSIASPFCATYTQAVITATAGIPSRIFTDCSSSTSRISSACSCLGLTTLVTTTAAPSCTPSTITVPSTLTITTPTTVTVTTPTTVTETTPTTVTVTTPTTVTVTTPTTVTETTPTTVTVTTPTTVTVTTPTTVTVTTPTTVTVTTPTTVTVTTPTTVTVTTPTTVTVTTPTTTTVTVTTPTTVTVTTPTTVTTTVTTTKDCTTTTSITPTSSSCSGGTAYGYYPGFSQSFSDLGLGNNWGWVITADLPILNQPLYMGAGQSDLSKATLVGTFSIVQVGSNVVLQYSLFPPFTLSSTHFYYSNVNPTKVAPGQYGNTHDNLPAGTMTDTFTVPFVAGNNKFIVHAGITC